MIWNYQKNFGKSKSPKEHQNIGVNVNTITWKIFRICRSYNPNSKRWLLCLHEKYETATYKTNNLLNKRNETKMLPLTRSAIENVIVDTAPLSINFH